MNPNPFLGVFFHWLGGLASGSFYVPYRAVRHWAWETYWLAGGFFSWIIMPWLMATLLTSNVLEVIKQTPGQTLFLTYFFGAVWGMGGLTFGLTMRYLGMSLGMAVALGYTAAVGTLVPPIRKGELFTEILPSTPGQVILFGVFVALVGIAIAGLAGMSKEREMPEEKKKQAIQEFNFKLGILVATFSGVMSAGFAIALDYGEPIKTLTLAQGTTTLWQGLPVLVVLLLGGFTTNFIWCSLLLYRNRTAYQYLSPVILPAPGREQETIIETTLDAPSEEVVEHAPQGPKQDETTRVPLLRNYFFSALAGTTWYMQFFFYTMGETQMGKYGFSSWTLHMASIIIFSTLWGIALHEWKGASRRTHFLVALGLAILIGSTIIIGYGNYLKPAKDAPAPHAMR